MKSDKPPAPADNLQPMDSAAARSKPPAGIACPACGEPVCGAGPRLAPEARRRVLATRRLSVERTTPRPNSIHRVRRCVQCGHRFQTLERVVSNGA